MITNVNLTPALSLHSSLRSEHKGRELMLRNQ